MTSLLVGTFVVGGVHTLLWLPRAFQMRAPSCAPKKPRSKDKPEGTAGEEK